MLLVTSTVMQGLSIMPLLDMVDCGENRRYMESRFYVYSEGYAYGAVYRKIIFHRSLC